MKLRIAVVGALVTGAVFAGAAPASATCRPERPSTCEPVNPIPDPSCDTHSIDLPDGSTISITPC